MARSTSRRALPALLLALACSELFPEAAPESRQSSASKAHPGPEHAAADAPVKPPGSPPAGSGSVRAPPQPTQPAPAPPRPKSRFPAEFQVVTMQGTAISPAVRGNTLQSVQAAHAQGVQYIEVDLFVTADDVLVTSHEAGIRECGMLSKMKAQTALACRLRHGLRVASLAQVLKIPFAGIYLDLKDTKDPERAPRAVGAAARAIVEAGREADVVVMVYTTPESALKLLQEHQLRAGMKGYPNSPSDTLQLVQQAAQVGFELVCVKAKYVTPEVVKKAAEQGIWLLPWSIDTSTIGHWQALAQAGIGGLIVLQYKLTRDRVAPHWTPLGDAGAADVEPSTN